jgi:HTH-type transcriptional regulator / antitoxin HigA
MRALASQRGSSDSYLELVQAFPLRPIRSETELDRAVAVLIRLTKSKPEEAMDAGERDYAEALTMLVQRFEQKRRDSALPKLRPVDRLKFLMEEQNMKAADLANILGSQASAPLILQGKKEMTKAQILKLAKHFSVSPALFME